MKKQIKKSNLNKIDLMFINMKSKCIQNNKINQEGIIHKKIRNYIQQINPHSFKQTKKKSVKNFTNNPILIQLFRFLEQFHEPVMRPYNLTGTTKHLTSNGRLQLFEAIKRKQLWLEDKMILFDKYSKITNVTKPMLKKEIKKLKKASSLLTSIKNMPLVAFHKFQPATQKSIWYDVAIQTIN